MSQAAARVGKKRQRGDDGERDDAVDEVDDVDPDNVRLVELLRHPFTRNQWLSFEAFSECFPLHRRQQRMLYNVYAHLVHLRKWSYVECVDVPGLDMYVLRGFDPWKKWVVVVDALDGLSMARLHEFFEHVPLCKPSRDPTFHVASVQKAFTKTRARLEQSKREKASGSRKKKRVDTRPEEFVDEVSLIVCFVDSDSTLSFYTFHPGLIHTRDLDSDKLGNAAKSLMGLDEDMDL